MLQNYGNFHVLIAADTSASCRKNVILVHDDEAPNISTHLASSCHSDEPNLFHVPSQSLFTAHDRFFATKDTVSLCPGSPCLAPPMRVTAPRHHHSPPNNYLAPSHLSENILESHTCQRLSSTLLQPTVPPIAQHPLANAKKPHARMIARPASRTTNRKRLTRLPPPDLPRPRSDPLAALDSCSKLHPLSFYKVQQYRTEPLLVKFQFMHVGDCGVTTPASFIVCISDSFALNDGPPRLPLSHLFFSPLLEIAHRENLSRHTLHTVNFIVPLPNANKFKALTLFSTLNCIYLVCFSR